MMYVLFGISITLQLITVLIVIGSSDKLDSIKKSVHSIIFETFNLKNKDELKQSWLEAIYKNQGNIIKRLKNK